LKLWRYHKVYIVFGVLLVFITLRGKMFYQSNHSLNCMFNKYFSQIGNHEEEKFRKLETVIRKKSFDSYEKLMNTWNIWK